MFLGYKSFFTDMIYKYSLILWIFFSLLCPLQNKFLILMLSIFSVTYAFVVTAKKPLINPRPQRFMPNFSYCFTLLALTFSSLMYFVLILYMVGDKQPTAFFFFVGSYPVFLATFAVARNNICVFFPHWMFLAPMLKIS